MKNWIKFGVIWGVFMFLILNVGFPLYDGDKLDIKRMVISFPVWIIFGLIFGYVSRSRKNTSKKEIKSK